MEKIEYDYYEDGTEGHAVKIDWKHQKAWAKYPGQKEYPISMESRIVNDCLVYENRITKEEYINYKDDAMTEN